MSRITCLLACLRVRALCGALVLCGAAPVLAQDARPLGREAMWRAPTAEEWQRPCLITWQRTWEDALAVARRTGQTLLVCVNMDGEIASEHYAGVRYRQPEIAALYEPYVTVIASVYRHSPRDYDEQGRRVPCPRFGVVTCGEHIAIEPLLFEQFMEGRRIAPRHIGVQLGVQLDGQLDGNESYDVYYAFDTASVFQAIRAGAGAARAPVQDRERALLERVASPDVVDRMALEAEYQAASAEERRVLLRSAVEAGDRAPVDLLRLAVFGLDAELNRLALLALAQANSESAIGLIAEALCVPLAAAEREALIAALERLGETWPRARTLAAVQRGLDARSQALDTQGWSSALADAGAAPEPAGRAALEYQLESRARELASGAADPERLLAQAEAALALAVDPETAVALGANPRTGARFSELFFADAREAALRAEAAGARGWRLDGVLALAAWYGGDLQEALRRAEASVAELPAGEESWNAMAVLALFAEGRQRSVYRAVREGEEWPAQWLTDVDAAYSVLARHPFGTDFQVIAHHDFLKHLGGATRAAAVLDAGLARFPESWALHDRLRARILEEQGVAGLEARYEAWLGEPDAPATLAWFAGYASLVAAEFQRRAGATELALQAYERALGHYERSIERDPAAAESCDHYAAIALAGRARLALEREDYPAALSELLRSFERRPEAAAALDGLGLSAVATAQTLRARLQERGAAELVLRLEAALAALDPELLLPPAFEREGPPRGAAGNRGAGRAEGSPR